MAISKLCVIHPRLAFVGVEILISFCFLWHNFGYGYARKQIKGSKDSHDSLVSKTNLSQKIVSLHSRLGPGKTDHKNAKSHLSSSSSWRVMAKRVPATAVAGAGVKGF